MNVRQGMTRVTPEAKKPKKAKVKHNDKPYHFIKCDMCLTPFLVWKNENEPEHLPKHCNKCQ